MRLKDESQQLLDPVKPGEQWFCYWKTSASLWEARILELPQDEIIFIPVYWGFHAEANEAWDFGKFLPERDLVRLLQILTRHGRKFCWLIPLTPAPFLPNGGLPISTARTLSVTSHGMHHACLDQDGTLHKMYSFFDSKVFKNYSSFVTSFAEMLAKQNSKSPVWGADFFYLENDKPFSFLNDSSFAFDQGFSRYLKKNYPQGLDLDQTSNELDLKKTFHHEVENLFRSLAGEALAPYWQGIKSITIFGAGPRETIERALNSGKSQISFFNYLFETYVSQGWFSTCLLNGKEKKQLLLDCLVEHFANNEIEHRFHYLADSSQIGPEFRPFVLMDLFDFKNPSVFLRNGLKSFLNSQYRWMYYQHESLEFNSDWIDSAQNRIKFFHAEGMGRTEFAQMLKLFMMGQRIIFDKTGLSDDLDKRLQVFYMENNLQVQSVNFLTSISLCDLGEGKLITFDGGKLKLNEEKAKFWGHVFKFLNMNHPVIQSDQDIFSLWRIRSTSSHELNYLDVRRVNFYNPTSYKKSIVVHTQKRFAFMKLIDPLHATAKTTPEGVEIELLPNGKLALDFGHYEVGV